MALLEAVVRGAVVFVGSDQGVVRADPENLLARLRRSAVDRQRVRRPVDGAPVAEVRLERRLDLPVLDQLLDEVWQAAGRVVLLLACTKSGRTKGSCQDPALPLSARRTRRLAAGRRACLPAS